MIVIAIAGFVMEGKEIRDHSTSAIGWIIHIIALIAGAFFGLTLLA